MIRTALIAAALLLGTSAEATPYKITMNAYYDTLYTPGTPKSGTMSFQAIINDPQVVTTTSAGEGGLDIVSSTTRFAAMFDTKVDGVTAAKSFMDLTLGWATIPNLDFGYPSLEKVLQVGFNTLSLPSTVQIAKPAITDLCNTGYQPYGACTLGPITSTTRTDLAGALFLDTYAPLDSSKKNILDFSLGNDGSYLGYNEAEVNWQATPPAGYTGDDPWPEHRIVYQFTLSNFTISPVPEPASWAILITGFGMVGATMRRKKRALAHA
ncbi:PEPxxWA-CTERM sorting domain-containing protein [Sphingomonas sp. ABOLE]|uniref:PEPxxWA-CTERM sorting domain-containing protein n=1 Tax=Sphingomonas sp. ABOLE TaxID=1985878 RepID=UPI001F4937AD|nr:PEPxxWA-CTERM sorting domain-containing protein [Sphingomonas sp. ABOLE]